MTFDESNFDFPPIPASLLPYFTIGGKLHKEISDYLWECGRAGWNARAAAERAASPDLERAAIALWHRFGADHRLDWVDEPNKAEFFLAAKEVLAEPPALREALRKLTFAARTSGGTAGPDAALMAACDEAEAALASLPHPEPLKIEWPKEQHVERHGDMGDTGVLRVTLDADNDVIVSTSLLHSVEFCNGGGGGGKSPHTRAALINLMSAMERDAAESRHAAVHQPAPEPNVRR